MKPNNVTRLLDSRGIPHTVYEFPPEKFSAVQVAQLLGVPPELVYKTIVVTRQGKGKPILAVVPGNREVDLKALARAVGEKKVHLPTERQAEQLTGLKAGGISPLVLLNRGFQILLDAAAQEQKAIYISGGLRGLNIRLPVSAFLSVTNAIIVEISV